MSDKEHEYGEFVRSRLPALHRQAFLLTGSAHHADDIVQQTCVNLYLYWRRACAATDLDSYVRAMLVRAFLTERRRGWWHRVRLTDEVPERAAYQSGTEDRAVLHAALVRLPRRQRAVLVLRYLYDLPLIEVAEILGCSEGTVKSQTFHGLSTMRKVLGAKTLSDLRSGG